MQAKDAAPNAEDQQYVRAIGVPVVEDEYYVEDQQ